MRWLFAFALCASAVMMGNRSAEAQDVGERITAPIRNIARTIRRAERPNFFERMMELERRKNAWLRRTFLD